MKFLTYPFIISVIVLLGSITTYASVGCKVNRILSHSIIIIDNNDDPETILKLAELATKNPNYLHSVGISENELVTNINNLAWEYVNKDDYAYALNLFEIEIKLLKALGNTWYDSYLSVISCKIMCLNHLGNFNKTISEANNYLSLIKEYSGANSKLYAQGLQSKATVYENYNYHSEAVKYYELALNLYEKTVGKTQMCYINCLRFMGAALQEIDNNTQKHIEIELKAEKLLSISNEASHTDKYWNFSMLSNLYCKKNDIYLYLKYAQKAREHVLLGGLENTEIDARSLSLLCAALIANNDYDGAIEMGQRSVDLLKKLTPNIYNSISYRQAVSNLSLSFFESGNIDKAITTIEGILSPNYPNDSYKLSDLERAITYYDRAGLPHKVKGACEKILLISESNHGRKSETYADALLYASSIQESDGDAIIMLEEAARIYESIHGKSSAGYINAQRMLLKYNYSVSDYDLYYNDVNDLLETIKSVYGDKSRYFYQEYNNFLFRQYSEAKESMDISKLKTLFCEGEILMQKVEKFFGDCDELYFDLKSILADMASYIYKFDCDSLLYNKAITYMTEIVDKSKSIYGESNIKYIRHLEKLAHIFSSCNFYDNALDIQENTKDHYLNKYGNTDINYADCLEKLSKYYFNKVIFDIPLAIFDSKEKTIYLHKAIKYANEALNIYKNFDYTQYISDLLIDLYLMYELNGEDYNAALCLKESFNTWREQIVSSFSLLTSEEKYKQINSKEWNNKIDLYSYAVCKHTSIPLYAQIAYDAQLLNKNILLKSEIELRDLIVDSKELRNLKLFDQLIHIRKKIAKYKAESTSVKLRKELKSIERQLMKESKQYGDYMRFLSTTHQDVKSHIKEDDICIEFATFLRYNKDTKENIRDYYALIIKKNYSSPKAIRICSEKDLIRTETLYNTIWYPLKEELYGVKNIYFSPTMTLNRLPIESVLFPDGSDFTNMGLRLYRVSSTREITKECKKNDDKNIVLYGGLLYDANIEKLLSKKHDKNSDTSNNSYLPANIRNDLRHDSVIWNFLSGTSTEITDIGKIARDYGFYPILYSGIDGTESSFKNLSGKRVSTIHIATHGFYIKPLDPKQKENEILKRSGLVFSGANILKNRTMLPEGIDDGILTALEISMLNLKGLDLVVLSACDTGLGDIGAEGVYGLQRGFKQAGAETIIMSLWKVDDLATMILMKEFYKCYLSGDSKRDAFMKAQNKVRTFDEMVDGVRRNFSSPKYWAAFIMLDGLE